EGRVRESRQLSGHLNPLSGVKAGRWVVSVEEKIGAVRGGEKSPWAGLSGAALFADNYLIGVMIGDADPAELNRLELWALPARMFADDPDFVRWVRWDSGDGAWTKSDKSPPSQISLLRRIAATTTPAPILIDPEHLHEHRRAKEIHFNNMLLPDFSIHE